MQPLRTHRHDAGCFVRTFSLSTVRWYAYLACLCHSLALYASLHACLHVHAWVLLASVLSMPQHNEVMDIRSKPTFVPCGHYLLFTFLHVWLHPCFYVWHIYHVYLLHASIICSLHLFLPLLAYWFLVFAFACTHMGRGRMELGDGLLGVSKRDADVSMWLIQAVVVSRFRSLAFPLWLCNLLNPFLPPPFLP